MYLNNTYKPVAITKQSCMMKFINSSMLHKLQKHVYSYLYDTTGQVALWVIWATGFEKGEE